MTFFTLTDPDRGSDRPLGAFLTTIGGFTLREPARSRPRQAGSRTTYDGR